MKKQKIPVCPYCGIIQKPYAVTNTAELIEVKPILENMRIVYDENIKQEPFLKKSLKK